MSRKKKKIIFNRFHTSGPTIDFQGDMLVFREVHYISKQWNSPVLSIFLLSPPNKGEGVGDSVGITMCMYGSTKTPPKKKKTKKKTWQPKSNHFRCISYLKCWFFALPYCLPKGYTRWAPTSYQWIPLLVGLQPQLNIYEVIYAGYNTIYNQ